MEAIQSGDIREPWEIVEALHRAIAAKSPEHAELVAAFEALPCGRSKVLAGEGRQAGGYARGQHISEAFRARLRAYLELRQEMSREQAAARLGIHYKTAQRYDLESYLADGLAPGEVSRA